MKTTLTTAQRTALALLKAARPFVVIPPGGRDYPTTARIKTGVNTTTLHHLRELGLIACSRIWLRGDTSTDLVVTATGEVAE